MASLVASWQQRILNEGLPVEEARTWAKRNMPKFAAMTAERLELAKRANTLDELEALLVSAPISNGTSLATLMATTPGNIAVDGFEGAASPRALQKSDPSTSPLSYADLAFTALNPCRMFDSRISQGGTGPFVSLSSRLIKVGPYPAAGGGYATGLGAQGGSASGCGLDTLTTSGGDIAAVMLAVSSFSQTGSGYLTFFSNSAPDPSASVVSMFYQAGPVQTAFVVVPTDLFGSSAVRGVSRNANTEVTLDIVGYFAKPHATAIECTTQLGPTDTVPAGGTAIITASACPAGYVRTALQCSPSNLALNLAGQAGANCLWNNPTATDYTGSANATCCRVAGR